MPNLLKYFGAQRWVPDADLSSAPQGVLLRGDNVEWDEDVVLRLRRGSDVLYSGLGSVVHSIYTAYINGVRYRFVGVDDKVFINGVDSGATFDGSGQIAFSSWLGAVFMERGTTKKKYDGNSMTEWGLRKPSLKAKVVPGVEIIKLLSNCSASESPPWVATEGTITATYPDGHDGQANGSIELTPASSGRATITRTFLSPQDCFTIEGYQGGDTDIVDIMVWLDKPNETESLSVLFGLTNDSDPFKDDNYEYVFEVGGVDTKARSGEVNLRSNKSVKKSIKRKTARRSSSDSTDSPGQTPPEEEPPPDEPELPDEDDQRTPRQRPGRTDSAYNPGWLHFSVPRGSFERNGQSATADWDTVYAVRLVYKAKAGGTGKCRFDDVLIRGGGERALTGEYQFVYQTVASRTGSSREFTEKSPPSDPSDPVTFNTQGADISIPAASVNAFEPQVDQLWLYMTGGLLDDWYRVAVSGASANDTSMSDSEFARSPDGAILAADRARFSLFEFSVPGSTAIFVPSDVTGLQAWFDAGDIDGLGDGASVEEWKAKVEYDQSGFLPSDVSTLTGWFRADAGVYNDGGTTLASDGQSVQQWNDQAGTAANLTQTTGAAKPIYRTSVAGLGGKPALLFDGSDDTIFNSDFANYMTSVDSGCVMVVCYPLAIVNNSSTHRENDNVVSCDNSGVRMSLSLRANGSLYATSNDGVSNISSEKTGSVAPNVPLILTWNRGVVVDSSATGVLSAHANNSHDGAGGTTSSGGALAIGGTDFHVGSRNGSAKFFNGYIAEVLVFDGQVSNWDRVRCEKYLASKYSIDIGYDVDSYMRSVQYESAKQPTYRSSWRNNKPAVHFDGSTRGLYTEATLANLVTAGAGTIFVVAEVDEVVNTPDGVGDIDNNTIVGDTQERIGIAHYDNSGLFNQNWNNDGATDFTPARACSLDAPSVWTWLHSSGNLYSGVNDTRTSSMNLIASGNTNLLTGYMSLGFGGRTTITKRNFKGYIAEVIVYDAALSESDRQKVESYLASKYDITIPYSLTAYYDEEDDTSGDVVVHLAADEIEALFSRVKLEKAARRVPDNVISVAGPYNFRLFVLSSAGYLYPSIAADPCLYKYTQAIRIGDASDKPYWAKATTGGIYVGTSKDIVKVYGSGTEYPDGTLNLVRVPLNVADPPVDSMVTADGNLIIYRAAKGPMLLVNDSSVPLPIKDIDLLWRGESRYDISGINTTTGEFKACVSNGYVYIVVPEGSSTTKSSVVYRFNLEQERWHRFTYPASFHSIYRELDGTVLAGDDSGNVWQLEVGNDDNGSKIPLVVWTPLDSGGTPLNFKDPHDLSMEVETGGDNLSVAIHTDNESFTPVTASVNSSSLSFYKRSLSDIEGFRQMQLKLTGSFSSLRVKNVNLSYRIRPQVRMRVDTGYIRTGREDIDWFREVLVCMRSGANVRLTPYFDDVAFTARDITVTPNLVKVYSVRLGREYKGYSPRLVLESLASPGTTENGFELYWIKFYRRGTGDDKEAVLRINFTDLVEQTSTGDSN